MADVVHFAGSPLDQYLQELGGDFAESGWALDPLSWERGWDNGHVPPLGDHGNAGTFRECVAKDAGQRAAQLFHASGLLEWHGTDAQPRSVPQAVSLLKKRTRRTLLWVFLVFCAGSALAKASLVLKVLGSVGLFSAVVEGAHLLNELWQIQRWRWVLTVSYDAALACRKFCVAANEATFWLKDSGVAVSACHTVGTPPDVQRRLLDVLQEARDALEASARVYASDLQSILKFHGREMDLRSERDMTHFVSPHAQKAALALAWEAQTALLYLSLRLLRSGEWRAVGRLFRSVQLAADGAHSQICIHMRLEKALLRLHGGELQTCGEHSRRVPLRTAVGFLLAAAQCAPVVGLEPSSKEVQTALRFLDTMQRDVDAVGEMLSRNSAVLGSSAARDPPEDASPLASGAEAPERPVREPIVQQQRWVTYVHQATGGMPDKDSTLYPADPLPHICLAPPCKLAFKSCVSELHAVLTAAGPPDSQVRDAAVGSLKLHPTSLAEDLEAWGSDVSQDVSRPLPKSRPCPRQAQRPEAFEMMEALQIQLSKRRPGVAIGDLEV